ncbi:MAG TPA: sugar ABC transporter ATP-binding protein [Verrucomicrobiales bacterium]|nr:sugar ABC transporter ATP-binding protein [Verrucomicrobiales bacterium]
MTAFAIELQDIDKRFFGVPVLRKISLSIFCGETLGLAGENGAGKSTLMNILGGNLQPDSGRLLLAGQPYRPRNPQHAAKAGIAFIHQELNLFSNLSVAENVFLTDFPTRAGIVDRRVLRRRTRELLDQAGLDLPPDTPVHRLSSGQRQLVEIAKALSLDPKVILFDEPTTSLTQREKEHLFSLIARLRSRGITLIYISHVLADLSRICDRVAVLRDGQVAGIGPMADFSHDRLITLMAGRSLDLQFPPPISAPAPEAVLEVDGLSRRGRISGIRFQLHRGEILGIAGLMGSGRTELARLLFGLDRLCAGSIRLERQPIQHLSPRQRIARGMAFLTEDRREEGLCLDGSIGENISLVAAASHTRRPLGWLRLDSLRQAVAMIRDRVRLTPTARDSQPVRTLSGGNQQKVVLAKWLLVHPRVLLLDEPARGIDVGAKHEIYNLIRQLAAGGAGILIISSEIEELTGLCDRILVLASGRLHDEIPKTAFDPERILRSAMAGAAAAAAPPNSALP